MRERLGPAGVRAILGIAFIAVLIAAATLFLARPKATAEPHARTSPSVEASGNAPSNRVLPRKPPLVIAHRGASAHNPENTIRAYRQAIQMGADYIEGDLEVTKDGVLVARHDRDLATTTDIASRQAFTTRRVLKSSGSESLNDWFVEDFTLAELKTLRATARHARSSHPPLARTATGAEVPVPQDETIPTVGEMISLAQQEGEARHRPVGLYLELKNPAFFTSIGLAPEPLLATILRGAALDGRNAPVFIESFDPQSLRTMHELVSTPLIQLIGGAGGQGDTETTPTALESVAKYAAGIGVDRARLSRPAGPSPAPDGATAPGQGTATATGTGTDGGTIPVNAGADPSTDPAAPRPGQVLDPTVVDAAHHANLEIHVYTFSDPAPTEPVLAMYRAYEAINIDGLFTDNPDFALRAMA